MRVSGVFLIVYSTIHHCNRNHRDDASPTPREPTMPLTRDFRETIQARVERLLSGEVEVGKAVLRDFINATVGFHQS